ncbi:MAG: hypothetical protein BGO04_02045 [Microbacterium sp. 70-38]|nr:MAG: hypothetical protein BGO04_02045 [Microbacterium sp. 70-38]
MVPESSSLLDTVMTALVAGDPGLVPWSHDARMTQNNVELPLGDGAWLTVAEVDRVDIRMATASGAAAIGIFREGPHWSPFCLRIGLGDAGKVAECELVVIRALDAAGAFCHADLVPRPEFAAPLGAAECTPVPEMLALVDGYFSTLQQNTGILHTRFDPACRRRENGVWTTLSSDPNAPPTMRMTCAESFQLGFFRPNERVRGRRTPLVDERTGLVLAGAFIDHSGRITEYELTDGRTLTSGFLRPHTYAMLELFKIVAGSITAIEAVFHPVPYGMRGAWVEEELSAPPRRS